MFGTVFKDSFLFSVLKNIKYDVSWKHILGVLYCFDLLFEDCFKK